MNNTQLKGSIVAQITPFDIDGRINEKVLRSLIDRQISEGTNGIVACGTTGESATLSHEEHHQVMDIIIDQVNHRVPVICGAGSNATNEAVSLSRYAEKAGADAILSVGPYYNKPSQEGLYQHYQAVAESVSIPIILYNVPGRTGSNISAETTLRLSEIENVIGVKEASGNMSQIMNILRDRPEGFLVFSGDDSLSLPLIALGLNGTISVVANETPKLFAQMINAALKGDWNTARNIHEQLLPLMEVNFIETNPVPAKTAMSIMGLIEEKFRLPLCPMTLSNRAKLESVLQAIHLV